MKVISSIAIGLLFASAAAQAHWTQAYVSKVVDGDTVEVRTSQQASQRLRLQGIDAPELDQPYGLQSQQALKKMVKGKRVRVRKHGKDPYKRVLATLHLDNRNVNHAMVEQGHAWAYPSDEPNPILVKAQQKAQQNQTGLWQLKAKQRLPPWEWRKANKRRK